MSVLRSLVERHYEQFANNDWDTATAAEIFSPDVETIDPGAGTMRGIEAFKAYGAAFHKAFPDGRLNLDSAVESGDTIAVEGRFTGTHTGPLAGPSGDVPPTGRKLDLPYCDVFQVKDGRITAHHVYYDQITFMTQLGLMPAPGQGAA
ncbi:MAG: ester cyclase [Thermomicrobiales bacterium]